MNVSVQIPAATIANMMVSFIESGDPVSSGWCNEVAPKEAKAEGHQWYSEPGVYEQPFELIVLEAEDGKQRDIPHRLDNEAMARGLATMASKYPRYFAQVMEDDADAPCADLFVQCCLFGEEKYS